MKSPLKTAIIVIALIVGPAILGWGIAQVLTFLPTPVWIGLCYILAVLNADLVPLFLYPAGPRKGTLDGVVLTDGVAAVTMDPEGKVRIGNELWDARSQDGQVIPEGSLVEVCSRDGMRLTVRPRTADST